MPVVGLGHIEALNPVEARSRSTSYFFAPKQKGNDNLRITSHAQALSTEVLSEAISILVITCLNTGPRAIARDTTGGVVIGTYAAITLCDNSLSVFDFETGCIAVRKRCATDAEQHAQSRDKFHRRPRTQKPCLA
jgi:hypothetical protein